MFFLWKDELIEILFSNDPSKINAKKAINLKYDNTPSSLYQYKPFNDHSLELLETDKMWLSRPTEFNDPFDCTLKLATGDVSDEYFKEHLLEPIFFRLKQSFGISIKELGKLKKKKNVDDIVKELTKLYVKSLMKKYKIKITPEQRANYIKTQFKAYKEGFLDPELKEKIYVACLSETNESILMWSHYANNHKGFCIEYNFKELEINNPITRFIFPVLYSKAIFDMKDYLPDSNKVFGNVLKNYLGSIKEDDILKGLKLPESNTNLNNMVVFYNALIKYEGWAYEKEWRYVFPYQNVLGRNVHLNVPKPKAIYLGAMACKENCKKILEIGKERDINIYKMEIKPSEFALESNIIHECDNIQKCDK